MANITELSNNEILMEIKKLQTEHEIIKMRMLKDYEKLESIEKLFNIANDELIKRIKGDK